MKEKIGLFFGSFNPIHHGHLIIANYMVERTDLDEVWLVVSPQSPMKSKAKLANVYDRLEMVRLGIGDDNLKIRSCDIELKMPVPSYTSDTLAYLAEAHPDKEFALIMGEDNTKGLHKWKNYEFLIKNYHIYVYPRISGIPVERLKYSNIYYTEAPSIDISSSYIRKAIKEKKSIEYIVPKAVKEFIESGRLYLP